MGIAEDAAMFQQQNSIADDAAKFQQPEPQKETPGFLKKLDLFASGVDRGVKNFTLGLMSKLPFGDRYQNAVKQVDADATAVQEYNKKHYDSWAPQVGEVGGELLATAPLGGVFGGALKAGAKAAEMAPYGLKTIAKYGTAGVGTTEAAALQESQRYDPNNPGQLFNKDAAMNVLEHPVGSMLAGAAGAKLNTYMDATKALQQAKEIDPYATARSIKDPNSPSKKFEDQFYGILPAITGMGHQVNQRENIGNVVIDWIRKNSASPKLMDATPEELYKYGGDQVKGTLNVLQKKAQLAWEKPFKDAKVPYAEEIKNTAQEALKELSDIPQTFNKAVLAKTGLERTLKTSDFTVDTVKNLRSYIGDAISEYKLGGKVGSDVVQKFSGLRNQLEGYIQKALPDDQFKDYLAAKQQSSMVNDLKDSSGLVGDALFEEVSANKILKKLIGPFSGYDEVKGVYNKMSDKSKQSVVAAQLAEAFRQHNDKAAGFDLNGFLSTVKEGNFPDAIRNTDTFKAFEGLKSYLGSVNDASKVGFWKQAAAGATVGSMAGIGLAGAGLTGAAAPLATYAATMAIANHSPLKRILGALTKKLSDSTYENLTNAASKHMSRIGVTYSNGVLRHKYNKDVIPEENNNE